MASPKVIRICGGLQWISATITIQDFPCHSLRNVSTRPFRIKTRRLELGGATPSRSTTRTIQQTDTTTISNILEALAVDRASSRIPFIHMDTKVGGRHE